MQRLQEEIALERSRVVSLSALTEPLRVMSAVIDEVMNNSEVTIRRGLVNYTVNSHDYIHLYGKQITQHSNKEQE